MGVGGGVWAGRGLAVPRLHIVSTFHMLNLHHLDPLPLSRRLDAADHIDLLLYRRHVRGMRATRDDDRIPRVI